ncbi:AAA-like domain-containing protein [Chloroflexi bacterium TSY]|nr:AAA-like domain-containing protein [Chloroflexi bacterium TSY]
MQTTSEQTVPKQPVRLSVGGDVQASNGTYIERVADKQLYDACLAHDFSYVLACRQIGKSSLKNAVAERLIAEGVSVSRIDLNVIGKDVSGAEEWYYSLLDQIAYSLHLESNLDEWWERQPQQLSLVQRFMRFFDEIVLATIHDPIVIFIDEIDLTLGLSFTGDFLGWFILGGQLGLHFCKEKRCLYFLI